jgi:hypothetical protein
VPAVAGGSAAIDHELRVACVETVRRAISLSPDEVVVVASTPSSSRWGSEATWSFAGFGVQSSPTAPPADLPWSLGIGAWLLDECGWSGPRRYLGVGPHDDEPPPDGGGARTVVISIGDGSARRSERAPGHFDPRSEAFDDHLAECLARGDVGGLAGADEGLAIELWCHTVPVWQWVAASVGGQAMTAAELVSHTAPYGVGYFVALWTLG